jgi:hypothetical protein
MAEENQSSNKNLKTGVSDWRHILNGRLISGIEFYADQPYIVKTDDGAWLCVVTTGAGKEGEKGQHVISLRSSDQGRTWSDPVDIEPAEGPESSYVVVEKVPSGRIYCFYNHNTDNIRSVKADVSEWIPDGICKRVDSLGHFVFKYSDDNGRTWSEKRYDIPVREFEIDRNNVYKGEIKFFWNVGKAFIHDGAVYVSLHKVGGFGYGFFTSSEGVLVKSENIMTEKDPEKITWETLPDGEKGLRTPPGGGKISEEHSYSVLSDGSFYSVYRSIDGHPVCTYSRDGGHTWDTPKYKSYDDGRLIKHPRAANFVWKCSNGKYLYWFHNHGGTWYEDRNPVWICGGIEADGTDGKIIEWTQPEILMYDDDPYVRMSYPDLVEEDGQIFVTETQKFDARVHEIPNDFLEKLWNQFENTSHVNDGLILEYKPDNCCNSKEIQMHELPVFNERDWNSHAYGTKDLRNGFTIEMVAEFESLEKDITLFDSRNEEGQGILIKTAESNTVEIVLNDGRTQNSWACDPGMLETGKLHHIGMVIDAGPKIITFIIDGKVCDGGEYRQFGWGRFNPNLRHANGSSTAAISGEGKVSVKELNIYDRALMNSEVISSYRSKNL